MLATIQCVSLSMNGCTFWDKEQELTTVDKRLWTCGDQKQDCSQIELVGHTLSCLCHLSSSSKYITFHPYQIILMLKFDNVTLIKLLILWNVSLLSRTFRVTNVKSHENNSQLLPRHAGTFFLFLLPYLTVGFFALRPSSHPYKFESHSYI